MGTLRQEVKRLAAALKMSQDLDEINMRKIEEMQSALDAMTAERDALVGAAYVAAAKKAQRLVDLAKTRGHVHHRETIAKNIRALTPADASTALEAVKAKARAEGMRMAAELANTPVVDGGMARSMAMFVKSGDWKTYKDACLLYRDTILAAAEKEAGK